MLSSQMVSQRLSIGAKVLTDWTAKSFRDNMFAFNMHLHISFDVGGVSTFNTGPVSIRLL